MDWLGLEHFVVDLLRASGFEATRTQPGADGGIDIELRPKGSSSDTPAQALVQCKARASKPVGVDKVRELLGVVASTGARRGILVTNSGFTEDARVFALTNQDRLLLGDTSWILNAIAKQPETIRLQWEAKHLKTGYDIPSCVQCEIKLRARRGPHGPFWGCPNYTNNAIRCKRTLPFRNIDYVHLPPPRS
ncbi:MAG: restriction endonuclease [Fibrobacteria bacterium]|nr:restriction endonuclease [Fibrobacteria bacterium]